MTKVSVAQNSIWKYHNQIATYWNLVHRINCVGHEVSESGNKTSSSQIYISLFPALSWLIAC